MLSKSQTYAISRALIQVTRVAARFSAGVVFLLVAVALQIPLAYSAEPGESAYSFLNIGTDARAEALGGAYTGVASGLGGITYNAAALAKAAPGAVSATYINWVTDIQSGFIAAAWRLGSQARMGVTAQYLDFGDFLGFDQSGVSTPSFGASDFAAALHAAGPLTQGVSWGVGVRFISESIDDEASTAFAADAGVLYDFPDGRTRIGAALRNLGAQSKSIGDGEKDDLPITGAVGVSHRLRGAPLMVTGDVFKKRDDDFAAAAGVEFSAWDPVVLRAGYNSLTGQIDTGSSGDDLAGLTFGVGFALDRILIDYSYGSLSELGDAHRFTLRSGL